jgi:hypothetical protein
MTRRLPHPATLLTSIVALLLILTVNPGPPPTRPTAPDAATAYLRQHPGGTRLNENEVQYGALVVTIARPTATAAVTADCPAGWFCFYDGTNYAYPRGKLSACGGQDLTQYGWSNRVNSAYYNLLNGKVTFYDSKTSAPNDDVALFTISTATRGNPDAGANRNKADYVYRTC